MVLEGGQVQILTITQYGIYESSHSHGHQVTAMVMQEPSTLLMDG